jgi:hypothetical protein
MADAGLARFASHAQKLMRLQRILDSATPLTRRARISNVKLGKIFIFADNSAVAAKLRQMEPRLIKVFQAEAAEVTGIEIRVQPGRMNRPAPRTIASATIGIGGKRGLTSFAEALPEESALRLALKRLLESAK